jgi:hypothetical protein
MSLQTTIDLYFDWYSKLLIRMTRYADPPLGHFPSQIDFSDYRFVAGLSKSRSARLSGKRGRVALTQIEHVQSNLPIDAAEFANPTSNVAQTSSGK